MTYTITPNKGHYDVYINGKLYCTADSMQEAEREIKEHRKENAIMDNVKTYYTNDSTYTFDVIEKDIAKVPVWYARCRENGKFAWLDREGIQFDGEHRFSASTAPIKANKCYITYEYDPLYPDDCIPITRFHNSLAEAKSYAEKTMWQFDIHVDIYVAERDEEK